MFQHLKEVQARHFNVLTNLSPIDCQITCHLHQWSSDTYMYLHGAVAYIYMYMEHQEEDCKVGC